VSVAAPHDQLQPWRYLTIRKSRSSERLVFHTLSAAVRADGRPADSQLVFSSAPPVTAQQVLLPSGSTPTLWKLRPPPACVVVLWRLCALFAQPGPPRGLSSMALHTAFTQRITASIMTSCAYDTNVVLISCAFTQVECPMQDFY